MNVQKVLNDGKITGSVIRFLTPKGWRTPKEMWIGYDSKGEIYTDTTKKALFHISNVSNV